MAQELLSALGLHLGGVTRVPGIGGMFEILANGELVWERKRDGGYSDAKVPKRRLRDHAAPGQYLGHIDR